MDFFQTVGSTVYHHDFHVDSFFPFWTAALSTKSLHLGGFPNVAVFDVKNMPVIDEVSIVNGDGSETPVATYSAQITAHIVWQHAAGAPVSISGLTEPTLVPEDVVPGTPSVPQQPFSGSMGLDRASADFSAVAFAGDGSVVQKFHVEGVQSEFAELGTESLGVFAN